MELQYVLSAGLGGFPLTGPWLLISIGVLALLLGAMIAGICVLISKVVRAEKEKKEVDAAQARHDRSSYHWSFAPFVLLGAVPVGAYTAFSVLAWCIAVSGLVLAALVIIYRIKGYMFLSHKDASAMNQAEESREKTEEAYRPVYTETEEDRQDAYTPVHEEPAVEDEEAPLSVFAEEESKEEEQSVVKEVTGEEGELLPAVREEAPVVQAQVGSDPAHPYKVVEKTVIETQKEIIREVPAAGAKQSEASEHLMEKLTDFLDYELQRRKDADAEAAKAADADLQAFAKTDLPEDIDEDEDEEDEELDDAELADDENDIDDEEPDSEDRFTGNERIIGFDEDTGCYIVAHYRKSFEAKLIQARPKIKQYYSEIKNALLSYSGNKSRISWAMDSINNGRTQIAKINVKTNILELYLALEPETLEDSIYKGKNVGHKKKYTDTPFLYKIKSSRRFKWAMELVTRTCEEQGLSPIDIEAVNYEELYPFESTESLVARKLIKEYIREEKPATTFELAPDHVPAVPDEDPSVIPANANFSWEFDNEEMEAKAEEPVMEEPVIEEESTPEEPVVEAPAEEAVEEPVEEPAAPVSTVVRETVKVTEMRYTERYYTDGTAIFEDSVSAREPVALELPAQETPVEEAAVEEIAAEDAPAEDVMTEEALAAEESVQEDAEEESYREEAVLDDVFGTEEPAEFEETEEAEESAEAFEEYYFDEHALEEPLEESEDMSEAEAVESSEAYSAEGYTEEYAEEYAEEEYLPEEQYGETYTEEYAEGYTEEEYVDENGYYQEEYAEYGEGAYGEEYAEEYAEEEPKVAIDPSVAVIDICAAADAFLDGDTVNLETLQEKGLVLSSATTLKIYATGALDKALSVEANHFTLDAIFAISEADGDTSMIY